VASSAGARLSWLLAEDLRVWDPDRSVRLHDRPPALFADKDAGEPDWPLTAARIGETPAALRPGSTVPGGAAACNRWGAAAFQRGIGAEVS
jgi:hypothetical protein